MANIQVKIQLQDTIEDEIDNIGSSNLVSNASIQKTNNVFNEVSTKNDGRNMKSWAKGYLSLKDGYVGGKDTKLVAQYGYNGYVFGAVPQSKQLEVTIEVIGENVDSIMIYGDKEANQFPTKAYIDGIPSKVFYSDDNEFPIRFDEPASASQGETSHTITFLEWNRADYNACITYVWAIKNELWLGNEYVKNVESLSQSTDRPDELFYGVIPSSGSLELIDRKGDLKEYVENGIIENSNLPIEIYCNNKMVHRHITTDSDYSTNVLSMQFEDELAKWENLQYSGYAYPKHSETAYNMLVAVLTSVGYEQDYIDEMLDTEIIYGLDNKVGKVSDYLKVISIPYPYLESASVRATIDKFCVLAQLQVLLNDKGKIKFVSARPRATESELENTIPFGKNRIFETPEKSIIIRNKYEAVEMNETKVKDEIEYNTLCYVYSDNTEINQFDSENYGNAMASIMSYSGSNYLTYTYTCILLKYKQFSFTIPKNSNHNLIEIIDMKDGTDSGGNPYIDYKVTYKTIGGTTETNKIGKDTPITPNNTIRDYENGTYSDAITGNLSTEYELNYGFVIGEGDKYIAAKAENLSTNKNKNLYSEDDDNYYITLSLLVSKEEFYTKAEYNVTTGEYTNTNNNRIRATRYDIFKLEISFYGDRRVISFEDISASDSNIIEAKTFAHIDNNELIQTETYEGLLKYNDNFKASLSLEYVSVEEYNYKAKVRIEAIYPPKNDVIVVVSFLYDDNYLPPYITEKGFSRPFIFNANEKVMDFEFGSYHIKLNKIGWVSTIEGYPIGNEFILKEKISNVIKTNIKKDYANGITTSKITIPCLDYYNEYGNLEKDFAKGEIVNVGDIARVVKNERIRQKATGRTFRKQGVPMIDLELQEINENFDN